MPDILRAVVEEEGLSGLPLLSFGASSGGSFALRVGALMPDVKVSARAHAGMQLAPAPA